MSVRIDVLPEVLRPRLPQGRVPLLALTALAVVLVGIPLYQLLYVGSGSAVSTEGTYAPKIRVALDRTDFGPGETIRGVVTITAIDAAEIAEPVELSVYPAGVPQTPANRVASAQLRSPRSTLSAEGSIEIPFELELTTSASGGYDLNAELVAQVDGESTQSINRIVATAAFTIR